LTDDHVEARFEIRPNDSSGGAQFAAVAALLALPCAACAAYFAAAGAWIACVPAVGTALASVWALAVDTRLRRERVEFAEVRAESVTVHDSEHERPGEWFEMSRAWLRLDIESEAGGGIRLALAGPAGRRAIARHLNQPERHEFARAIAGAIHGQAIRPEPSKRETDA